MFFDTIKTKQGTIYLSWNTDEEICALSFCKATIKGKRTDFPASIKKVAKRILEYINNGRKDDFIDVKVSLEGVTPNRKHIYNALRKIKAGKTISYKDLGLKIGKKNYGRIVGTAMANNPIPVIIPCHRVIRSDGGLGGYSVGKGQDLKLKQKLLDNEKLISED